MADFNGAEPVILEDEGVYSNTPGDDGRETCFGIDVASNPTWPGWPQCHALLAAGTPKSEWHLDQELMTQVNAFYRAVWDSLHGDQENSQSLGVAIFGGVINQGPARVIKMVQTCACALGRDVAIDGQLGQGTVDACNALPPDKLLLMLKSLRRAAYIQTAAARPNDRQFIDGWFNRLDSGA